MDKSPFASRVALTRRSSDERDAFDEREEDNRLGSSTKPGG